VQQVVEEALGALLDGAVRIHGAGRTDAGVHARGQVAHLDPRRRGRRAGLCDNLKALVHGTNHHLPASVRVMAAQHMAFGFHARTSAMGKLYRYTIATGPVVSPFDAPRALHERRPLDTDAMARALAFLPGRHDFSAFAVAGGSHSHGVRRLFAARLDCDAYPHAVHPGQRIRLSFWGDGFLRGMVRSLAGTLVEIGRGERSATSMAALLVPGTTRDAAGFTADARGLCLERVVYPPVWRPLAFYPDEVPSPAGDGV
jgi:tRNA pseudouridine38-40 synthase